MLYQNEYTRNTFLHPFNSGYQVHLVAPFLICIHNTDFQLFVAIKYYKMVSKMTDLQCARGWFDIYPLNDLSPTTSKGKVPESVMMGNVEQLFSK